MSQELIAKGEVEMGLYNVSEIPEGKGTQARRARSGAVADHYELRRRADVGRRGSRSCPRLHPVSGQPEARASWVAARLEPLGDK